MKLVKGDIQRKLNLIKYGDESVITKKGELRLTHDIIRDDVGWKMFLTIHHHIDNTLPINEWSTWHQLKIKLQQPLKNEFS